MPSKIVQGIKGEVLLIPGTADRQYLVRAAQSKYLLIGDGQ